MPLLIDCHEFCRTHLEYNLFFAYVAVELSSITYSRLPLCVNTYAVKFNQLMMFVLYGLLYLIRDQIEGDLDNSNLK